MGQRTKTGIQGQLKEGNLGKLSRVLIILLDGLYPRSESGPEIDQPHKAEPRFKSAFIPWSDEDDLSLFCQKQN